MGAERMGCRLGITSLAVAACLGLAPLAAQTGGLPLRNPGVRSGLEVGAEFGFGRASRPAPAEDETVRVLAATVAAGAGPAGIWATLARADRNGDAADRTVFTGAAGLRVFGGPLVPLSVTWQGAVAVPLGLGAALTIPVPVLAITPWLAPRADYFGRQPVVGSRVKAALAAGVDLGLLNGLVIRAAYDSRIGWEPAGDGPPGVSLGLGYRFR